MAEIARAGGCIPELRLKILELEESFCNEALRDLEAVESELAQLIEKQQALADSLRKLVIRAPLAGIIHEMTVYTIGRVVRPGETLLLIVPQTDALVVDAIVSPQDIDQIAMDQPVHARLTAFNQRTMPELHGRVIRVAADQSGDTEDAPAHFKVRVQILDGELEKLGDQAIVPGMPTEVMITTSSETVLTYLTKPVTDQLNSAFRDR